MHNCRQGGALNASVICMRKPPIAEICSLFRTKRGVVSLLFYFGRVVSESRGLIDAARSGALWCAATTRPARGERR